MVKRAVIEQNGQLIVVQGAGDENWNTQSLPMVIQQKILDTIGKTEDHCFAIASASGKGKNGIWKRFGYFIAEYDKGKIIVVTY